MAKICVRFFFSFIALCCVSLPYSMSVDWTDVDQSLWKRFDRYFLSDSFLIFVSVQMIREKSLLSNNKAKKHSAQITTTRKISEIDWHGIIMRMIPRYYPGIFVSMSHTFQFYASSSSDRGNVYTDQIRVNRLFFGDSEPIDLSLSMWIGEKAPARQSNHQYSIRSNSVQKYALIL